MIRVLRPGRPLLNVGEGRALSGLAQETMESYLTLGVLALLHVSFPGGRGGKFPLPSIPDSGARREPPMKLRHIFPHFLPPPSSPAPNSSCLRLDSRFTIPGCVC